MPVTIWHCDGDDFISPHAVVSEYCQRELEHALKYHKRIVPLLIAPTPEAEMPKVLRGLQYVDFTDNTCQADYDSDIDGILSFTQTADYQQRSRQGPIGYRSLYFLFPQRWGFCPAAKYRFTRSRQNHLV